MTIQKQFADITEIFSADGYTFLTIRSRLETLEQQADYGDKDAEKLIDIVNKFHRLCMVLKVQ
jgi:hypothetical protein